jgi:hypothetical protein
VSRSQRVQDYRSGRLRKWVAVPAVAAVMLSAAHWCMADPAQGQAANAQAVQQPAQANPYHKPEDDARPDPVPPFKLDRTLKTIPVPRDRALFNVQMVDASLLPRDKKGIWVLDFAFKPLRIRTVEVPGKGRRQIH